MSLLRSRPTSDSEPTRLQSFQTNKTVFIVSIKHLLKRTLAKPPAVCALLGEVCARLLQLRACALHQVNPVLCAARRRKRQWQGCCCREPTLRASARALLRSPTPLRFLRRVYQRKGMEEKAGDAPTESGAGGAGAGASGRRRGRGKPALSLTHSLSLTHNSTRILDHIFLGGQEACSEKSTMTFLKITHVLNVSCECENLFPGTGGFSARAANAALSQLTPHTRHAPQIHSSI